MNLKHELYKIWWHVRGGYKPQQFWDDWAEDFAQDDWQRKVHPQHEWLLKKIQEIQPQSILEVGCGFGRNLAYIQKYMSGIPLSGIDISEKMIQQAKKMLDSSVELKVGKAENLPYSDDSFDLVFTHGVLMHVDPKSVLKTMIELVRVSTSHIIMIEQNYKPDNAYTFIHTYQDILSQLPVDIVEYKSDSSFGLDLIHAKIRN